MNSQTGQILTHLRKGRTLSSLNALNLFGCLRLAARVHELRSRGHKIEADMVKLAGSKKRVALYRM